MATQKKPAEKLPSISDATSIDLLYTVANRLSNEILSLPPAEVGEREEALVEAHNILVGAIKALHTAQPVESEEKGE